MLGVRIGRTRNPHLFFIFCKKIPYRHLSRAYGVRMTVGAALIIKPYQGTRDYGFFSEILNLLGLMALSLNNWSIIARSVLEQLLYLFVRLMFRISWAERLISSNNVSVLSFIKPYYNKCQ